jgi:hypothetical protein
MFKQALSVQDKLLNEFNECIRERINHVYQFRLEDREKRDPLTGKNKGA